MKRAILVLGIMAIMVVNAWALSPGNVRLEQGPIPGTVVLFWDANAEPDLAGYKVYWGRSSGNYTQGVPPVVGVMTQPTFTTPKLFNGTWYFAVTAFNAGGQESGFSNEVSTTIAVAPANPTGLRFTLAKLISAVWKIISFKWL